MSSLTVLGIVGATVQLFVIYALVKRKVRIEFPAFFYFAAWNTAATLVFQFVVYRFPAQFLYIYWSATAVSMLVSFWIFYEVFLAILKPYSALTDLGRMLFRWAAVFLLIASMITALSTQGSQFTRACAVIALLEQCAQLMQCGMLLLLLVFESRLGLSWRSHAMAVGLGVGLFAAWDLTSTYVTEHFRSLQSTIDITNSVVIIGFYVWWAVAFMLPEPRRKTVMDSPTRLIFQRWNEALLATPLVGSKSYPTPQVESFLPGVEQTVERVLLARRMMD